MTSLFQTRARDRGFYVLAGTLTIAAGLASRRFPQFVPALLGKYPGDVLWALMIFLGFGGVARTTSTLSVALGVLAFCFAIEFLKLCDASWLVNLRHTIPGHLVFGQVFSWQNFVAYSVGVLFGAAIEIFALPRIR